MTDTPDPGLVIDEIPGVHPAHRLPAGPDFFEMARTKKIAKAAAAAKAAKENS